MTVGIFYILTVTYSFNGPKLSCDYMVHLIQNFSSRSPKNISQNIHHVIYTNLFSLLVQLILLLFLWSMQFWFGSLVQLQQSKNSSYLWKYTNKAKKYPGNHTFFGKLVYFHKAKCPVEFTLSFPFFLTIKTWAFGILHFSILVNIVPLYSTWVIIKLITVLFLVKKSLTVVRQTLELNCWLTLTWLHCEVLELRGSRRKILHQMHQVVTRKKQIQNWIDYG